MNEDLKTAYEWSLEGKIKIVDLSKWSRGEDEYMTTPISKKDFLKYLEGCTIVSNSTPTKPNKYLELRMYTLVPYNLSSIQKGIQHEHSVTQFSVKYGAAEKGKFNEELKYHRWANEWKTSILLNGGTSNEGHHIRQGFRDVWYEGTMQKHLKILKDNGINVSTFYEPDLNSMLTGISFIVDERVFNKDLYPDFEPIPEPTNKHISSSDHYDENYEFWVKANKEKYDKWVDGIGGPKNAFLREFLKPFKLA